MNKTSLTNEPPLLQKHSVSGCHSSFPILPIPDSLYYSFFKKRNMDTGEFELKNGHGEVFFVYNETNEQEIKDFKYKMLQEYNKKTWDRVFDKRNREQEYDDALPYDSLNFVDKAIRMGFETEDKKKPKTNDNWFGVSKYHPDAWLKRGEKTIKLSLQGMSMPLNIPEQYFEIAKKRDLKYIAFYENNHIIYESWTGEIPSFSILDKFLKMP